MILFLYQLLYPLIAAGILLRIFFAGRGRALREGRAQLRQRMGLPDPKEIAPLQEGGAVLWIHAASVGETLAAEPLIRALPSGDKRPRVLMTTSTFSGCERAKKIEGVDAALLLPMDFYPAVAAFLNRTHPTALILMEKEFWPMLLKTALARGIRIGIANGRITERSAKRYQWISSVMRPILSRVERACAQTADDAERFIRLGIRKEILSATGNMKYDLSLPDEKILKEAQAKLAQLGWSETPLWIAGSTRRGEEEQIIDTHLHVLKTHPDLRLILAPRHIERTEEVATLLRGRGLRFHRWSQLLPFQEAPQCLLLDQIGILRALYPASDACFVGGTLVPIGGHNLLEPALQSRPVLFGPHTSHTHAVAKALEATGGGIVVEDAETLGRALIDLLDHSAIREEIGKKALTTAQSFTGATCRTKDHLKPLWEEG